MYVAVCRMVFQSISIVLFIDLNSAPVPLFKAVGVASMTGIYDKNNSDENLYPVVNKLVPMKYFSIQHITTV